MIALDAMGGDYAPQAAVEGAIGAAKKGVKVVLFGDQEQLERLLMLYDRAWCDLPLSIVHCSQIIGMAEEPSKAARKTDASMMQGLYAVAAGAADAMVTAGNSGAALVGGTLIIDRIPGILRPALGNFLPTLKGSIFCIDLGATTECKPEFFEQFALMGHVYVRLIRGIEWPRVALLSNGHEAYKGSLLVKQAYALLDGHPEINFVGNMEARDLFEDQTDVLVCDGFTGNVMLKVLQGSVRAMLQWINETRQVSFMTKLALFFSRGALRAFKEKTDYANVGGALLFGLQKPVVVAHGCSHARAIEQAILFAHHVTANGIYERFSYEIQRKLSAKQEYGDSLPLSEREQQRSTMV